MTKHKKILYIVVTMTSIALYVFVTVLVHAFWYSPQSEMILPSASLPVQKVKGAKEAGKEIALKNYPARLSIPTLKIDAKIQKVGIAKNGNMATPSNFTDIGWYKYGTVPGDMGSAVMAGHVDNGLAFSGVFKRLGDLKKDDDVYVKMDNGKSLHYVVTKSAIYDYDAEVPEVFTENDDRYLKLITCTGTWMESNRTHNKRLVVTAVLVK